MIARYQPKTSILEYAPPVQRKRRVPRLASTYRAARRNALRNNRPKKPKNERLVMKHIERKE